MTNVWDAEWKIPKTIHLPGCRVKVCLVDRESPGLEEADAQWSYKHEENEPGYATIYIAKDLSLPVQRYCLLHELQHAMIELLDIMTEKYPKNVHAKWVSISLQQGWSEEEKPEKPNSAASGAPDAAV